MKTFVKIGFAQISLAAPKILVARNSGGGGGRGRGVLQPPSRNGTYAYGCYHLFFQLNNGVIIMEWIQ